MRVNEQPVLCHLPPNALSVGRQMTIHLGYLWLAGGTIPFMRRYSTICP